ncbi:hypothetical protein AB3S75_009312 [Citrus x aurantiifolia]
MAKGSGLSIDHNISDPIAGKNKNFFLCHQPTVLNSFCDDHHHFHKFLYLMDAKRSPATTPSTIQFPVCLNHDEDSPQQSSDDHHHHNKRKVIDEMDFFTDKNTHSRDHHHYKDSKLELNVNTGLNLLTTNTSSDHSTVDDGISTNMEDKKAKNEYAVVQAELERVNAENQRLKDMVNEVTNNYNALQLQLMAFMQHHNAQAADENSDGRQVEEKKGQLAATRRFIDLGLGVNTADTADEPALSSSEGRSRDLGGSPVNGNSNNNEESNVLFGQDKKEFVKRDDSPDRNYGPNKVPKFSSSSKNVDQTEATMRKARVSVRARSEAPMINDGCQWRKYGQKMAKGNPCPRAYYRCTMAAGCPVRKQVQRCAEDRTILITTYEGNHNHPLPPAAMAMASTTSSAARLLLSGSMSSADGLMNANFLARTLLPCSSSMATISASAPFPTVTLDLTQTPNPSNVQRSPNQFQVPFPNPSHNFANGAAAAAAGSLLPQIFGQALYNQSKFSGLQMSQDMDPSQLGNQSQLPSPAMQQGQQHNSLADSVSAATAAIAADPNFTAALAAAITSIINGGTPQSNNVTNNENTDDLATTTNGNVKFSQSS